MYQIGRAESPGAGDPHYDTEREAFAAARQAAVGDAVWAIWRYDSAIEEPIPIALIYQGDMWRLA